MTETQPDRQDGDGLSNPLERLLAAFKGMMPFPLVVQAVAEALVRDAETALATAKNERAELNNLRVWKSALVSKELGLATPKPAPDAVRTSPIGQADVEALNHLADSMGFGRTHDMLRRVIAATPYFSAPVPSPDGAGEHIRLLKALMKIAHYSPSSTVQPVAIAREALIEAIGTWQSDALDEPPSATGAAEPDAQMLEYARRLNDIAVDVELAQGGLGGAANARDLRRIAQQIVAIPPIRGDRETIKQLIRLHVGKAKRLAEDRIDWVDECTDAILSLPVQPGAGEREAQAIRYLLHLADAAYFALDDSETMADQTLVLERVTAQTLCDTMEQLDSLPDDQPGYTMTPNAKARWALRHLSRQAPQSSREG